MHNPLQRSSKPVAIWLLTGVAMIIIQIVLGGVTRLTGSGLSITEWDVITGTLPPMTEQQWLAAFDKYKQTSQFRHFNFDFTLHDFKFIYFWEWIHRLWARLMGAVFVIPFVIFLLQKRFKADMVRPMIILFLLGALQGVVGWIMVASGLTGDAVYVQPTRLALHFILALGLLCYTFWFALRLLVKEGSKIVNPSLQRLTWLIISVLTLQLVYGALMAGHKAGPAAPTWPGINGSFIPAGNFLFSGGWMSLIENKITIHFIHRMMAYLLFVLIIAWTWKTIKTRAGGLLSKTRWLPLLLVIIQTALGIFATLTSTTIVPNRWGAFEWLAQMHQVTAMLLLLSLILHVFLLKNK